MENFIRYKMNGNSIPIFPSDTCIGLHTDNALVAVVHTATRSNGRKGSKVQKGIYPKQDCIKQQSFQIQIGCNLLYN